LSRCGGDGQVGSYCLENEAAGHVRNRHRVSDYPSQEATLPGLEQEECDCGFEKQSAKATVETSDGDVCSDVRENDDEAATCLGIDVVGYAILTVTEIVIVIESGEVGCGTVSDHAHCHELEAESLRETSAYRSREI
jgi:hypothetical protein